MPQALPNPQAQVDVPRPLPATLRELEAPSPIRLWHLTSLDAPTVAVVWTLAFAWAAQVRLPMWIPVFVALAAWAVYIGDRLLDVRSALRAADLSGLRERHWFHHRHRRLLVSLAITAGIAATGVALTLMPLAARERNSVLAAAALAYFTRVHSAGRWAKMGLKKFSPVLKKELLVGLLFTAACTLPALSRAAPTGGERLWPLGAAAALFALLAWLNCHAIELWERSESTLAARILLPACLLGICGLLLAWLMEHWAPRTAGLATAGAASASLLAILDRFRNRLTPVALRAAADIALLTPLALLLR